jgi:hypothetical protein
MRDPITVETADDVDRLWAELTAPPPYLAREKAKRSANRATRRNRRRTKSFPKRRARWQKAAPITHAELLALLEYRPDEGRFVWRVDRRGRGKAGETAGSISTGGRGGGHREWRISVRGKVYPFARLVHFYQTGTWPGRHHPPSGGGTGVYRRSGEHAKPFAARLRVDGIVRALGTYATEEAALAAVAAARKALLPAA